MSIREFFKRVPPPTNVKNVVKPTTTNKIVALQPRLQPSIQHQQVQIPVQIDPNLRSFDEIRILFQIFKFFQLFVDIFFCCINSLTP